jgi:hypothetical protein
LNNWGAFKQLPVVLLEEKLGHSSELLGPHDLCAYLCQRARIVRYIYRSRLDVTSPLVVDFEGLRFHHKFN